MVMRYSVGVGLLVVIGSFFGGYGLYADGLKGGKINADEVYLLPEGYTGPVRVIYGVESGERPAKKDGARVYRVPKDGVLLTQSPLNPELEGEAFFHVQADGSWERIDNHLVRVDDESASQDDPSVYVFHDGIGRISSPTRLDCGVYYRYHWVGTKAEILESVGDFDAISYLFGKDIGCDDIASNDERITKERQNQL